MLKLWLWLVTRKGFGTRSAYQALRKFPSVQALYDSNEAAYTAAGLRNFEPLLDKSLWMPEEILRRCRDRDISLVTFADTAYPSLLRALEDPPLVLYYRGKLPSNDALTIGVVGTRAASINGQLQARRLGYSLGRCGCTLVSGGAKGIDAAAMEGALTGSGTVVAVLGGGVDVVYPRSNRQLFEDVVWHGCLLSEYPPGTQPLAAHFPVRNRIISGMSHGVLVVEAPEKSGALITAYAALEQGRDVFAVPGSPSVKSCSGNLNLLRDGAILVRDAVDILQEYQGPYPDLVARCIKAQQEFAAREQALQRPKAKPEPEPQPESAAEPAAESHPVSESPTQPLPSDLSPEERKICGLLQEKGAMQIDNLVEESEIPAGQVLASLTMLEIKGIVRRLPARYFTLAGKYS